MFSKKKVFIVAEIGNNHEGSINIAKKLIKKAAEAGADAVKFQTFVPRKYVSINDIQRTKQLKKFQFTIAQFKKLFEFAKKHNVIFFSTPFDINSAKSLNKFQKIFKISSGDNNFFQLIETVANFNKPLIISTGFADLKLVKKIYDKVKKIWNRKKLQNKLVFMHCVSSYPVENKDANIKAILTFRNKFKDVLVGYSDHTIGNNAAKYSVLLGAQIIEKHFTLDKNFSKFRDHKLSADPKQLKELIKDIRNIPKYLGDGKIKLENSERKNLKQVRRSIIAKKNLYKNNLILESDLDWVRPGNGILVGQEKKLIGRTLKKNIRKGENFTFKHLK